MITAVLDNQIWLDLITSRDRLLLKQLHSSLTSHKLTLFISPSLTKQLFQLISTHPLASLFARTYYPLFTLHTPTQHSSPYPQLSDYSNLAISTHADYLVPANYTTFRPLDGLHNINVLELDNFFKFIK